MSDLRANEGLSRRQFLVNSAIFTSTLALAACAPGGGAVTEAEPAAADAPVDEDAPDIADYGGDGTPVTIWHGLGGADGKTFAVMLEDYATQQEQPIRSETYGWDVFFQKFPTSVAAGTPPDMAIFHGAEVAQMTDLGVILPLDELLFSDKLPREDFVPAIMDTVTVGGNIMAVPFDNHGWNGYVNVNVIEEAGGDIDNLPANGAEFIELAIQITTDENGNHPGDAGFDADNVVRWAWDQGWPRFTYPSIFGMFGAKIFDADSNTATLNSDESIAAIQYVHDLMYTHQVARPPVPGMPWIAEFAKNDGIGFWWDGTWMLNWFKDNPEVQEVTIGAPLSSFAPDGNVAQKMDSHILALPTGVDEAATERSITLMEWLSNEGATWATSGQIPARLSVQQLPEVQEIWSVKSASENFNNYGQTDVPHKAFIEIQTAWEAAVSTAVTNTQPIEDALNEGNATIQAILDRG